MVKTNLKRGDTFNLSVTVSSNDLPVDISDWDVISQVRDDTDLKIADLIYTLVDGPLGKYTLTCSDTTSWPIKTLLADIQYTINDQIISTDTFSVVVHKDISR